MHFLKRLPVSVLQPFGACRNQASNIIRDTTQGFPPPPPVQVKDRGDQHYALLGTTSIGGWRPVKAGNNGFQPASTIPMAQPKINEGGLQAFRSWRDQSPGAGSAFGGCKAIPQPQSVEMPMENAKHGFAAGTPKMAVALPQRHRGKQFVVNGIVYYVQRLVGKGLTGQVYRAVEHICKEVVAIKVVDAASMDPWVYEGAKNEVELLRMLKGRPGVIQMIDSEEKKCKRESYTVLEWGGLDLHWFLNTGDVLKLEDLRNIFGQMVQSVRSAHEAGVIHRDIKPANFTIKDGRVQLIDFGCARKANEPDAACGTTLYMAPEAHQSEATEWSDVYSLGCCLFTMIKGEPPFHNVSTKKLPDVIESRAPENLAKQVELFTDCPKIQGQVQEVLDMCLAKRPIERWCMKELIDCDFLHQR